MATKIHIEIWDEPPSTNMLEYIEARASAKTYLLKLSHNLTEAEKGRILQALGNFARCLQLWLEDEAKPVP